MTKPRLDTLITRGRELGVRADHTRRYVEDLARWTRPEPARARRWWPWLGGLTVAAAIAVVAIVLRTRPDARGVEPPVRVGERIAIVAEPGAVYRVVTADADHSELAIERGTVTARLFPGALAHHLVLRGGGLEAVATGTIYSLTVEPGGSVVSVHEGKVAVTDPSGERTVTAGETWPPHGEPAGADAASVLRAMPIPAAAQVPPAPAPPPPPPPPPLPVPPPTTPGLDAGVTAHPRPVIDAGAARGGSAAVVIDAPTLAERWRAARLYRSQARFDEAIVECLALADARDPTWSPIALVEAARIELGPRAAPERAIALTERFAREWPGHSLARDASELRCRALHQLGRDDGCAPDAGP